MRIKSLSSALAAGVALGLFGMSVTGTIPLTSAWSADRTDSPSGLAVRRPGSVLLSTSAAATADQAAAKYGWGKVVAGDEFNYKGRPDSQRWRVFNSKGHDGNGLRRASAWRVDGRVATVTGDAKGTTGGMASLYGQKYGRWEARMKTGQRDPKYHPDILLWPHVRGTENCPEVNFAEGTNNTKLVKFFLHFGCHGRGTAREKKAVDMRKWHNYAVEWTPTQITGYIDGVQFFKDRDKTHLPSVSMHACIQLDWFPDRTRTKKTTMSVDWI